MRSPIILSLTLLCLPALADQQPVSLDERLAGAIPIPEEKWRMMALGRTLTYEIDGSFFAHERYDPYGNGVTLELYDGTCLQGIWQVVEGNYCYFWEGEAPACFAHAMDGKEILIFETEPGGLPRALQKMTGVSDKPLTCGQGLVS